MENSLIGAQRSRMEIARLRDNLQVLWAYVEDLSKVPGVTSTNQTPASVTDTTPDLSRTKKW
jgi:hypothetical protein